MTKEEYNKALVERIESLMKLSTLNTYFFAEFINISEPHMYAILNGNRNVSTATIDKIKSSFPFKKGEFILLSRKIDKRNIDFTILNKFKVENKERIETDKKLSELIESELLIKSKLFDAHVSTNRVRQELKEIGKNYDSKRISQTLDYFVIRGLLKKQKERMKLKNGKLGVRHIYVYWKK